MPPLISFVVAGPTDAEPLLGPELAEAEVVARSQDATGEYLWFLEGPLEPGAIAGVAERLRATAPDLLVADSGAHKRVLERVDRDGVVTLERRPGLAATAPQLGDKVLRREFARGLDVAAADLAWPALLTAERIVAAPGARCSTAPDAPGDYAAVFAFLAAHPEIPESRRKLVAPAIVQHELAILRRLPTRERAARFAALTDLWRAHGKGSPGGPGARLVARGSYRRFQALEASRTARRMVDDAKRRARTTAGRTRGERLDRHYRKARRAPIDPQLAVFGAYWYRGYACNPRAIYEKARELVPDLRGVWVVRPDGVQTLPPGVEHVQPNTREYFDVLARAGVLVNNANFPNHYVKREGQVFVQTHHGTPLKAMGLDLKDSPIVRARMDFEGLLRRCGNWDFSVSANPFTTEIWERVYPTGYETLEVGYPRNDVLANATDADVARVRAELDIAPGQTAVLYAPTHREFRASYVPVLDVAAVAEALGPEHVLLVRAHYFYGADAQLAELHREGRIRDVAAHPSVEELCLAADVLLTDYSSLMFDYAVLDRPIVIHAPDWEAYRALRGVYFDVTTEGPGPVARTGDEVVAAVRAGDDGRARAAFRARFCALEDGHAAERVVRRVWLGEREVTAPRPAPVTS
jgi:CDP-glycerol glycerophosphotransferase